MSSDDNSHEGHCGSGCCGRARVIGLSELSPTPGSVRRRKRLGIGEGSGNGKTCGKGQKGQRSRSGYSHSAGFEGGQMPIHRRTPKRGFTSRKKVTGENVFALLSLRQLSEADFEGEISIDTLVAHGLVRNDRQRVKLLAGAEISKALFIEVHAASRSAVGAIEKAGGSVRIIR